MLWEVDIYAAEGQPDLGAATWPPRPPNCTALWRKRLLRSVTTALVLPAAT